MVLRVLTDLERVPKVPETIALSGSHKLFRSSKAPLLLGLNREKILQHNLKSLLFSHDKGVTFRSERRRDLSVY